MLQLLRKMAIITSAIALVGVVPLFAGGEGETAGPDDGVVTLEFLSLFAGPDGTTIDAMVNEYNESAGADAGIYVDILTTPHADYYTRLTVSVASGEGPNIAINHSDRVLGYVAEDALLPLDENQLAQMGIREEDFVPALWQAGAHEGERYALPIDAFPQHLFYNRQMFEEAGFDPDTPPQTLDELVDVAQAMTDGSGDKWGFWFPMSGAWAGRTFLSVYWQFEDDLLNADNSAVSDGFISAAERTLELLGDFIHEYEIVDPDASDFDAQAALMGQNRLGIILAQITHINALLELDDLDLGGAALPTFGDRPAAFALGHNFVLPRGPQQSDEKVEAAYHFFDWFSRNSLAWVEGGKIPASQIVMDTDEFRSLPVQSAVGAAMDHVKMPPLIPAGPSIHNAIVENVEAYYGGVSSISETARNMARDINDVLD